MILRALWTTLGDLLSKLWIWVLLSVTVVLVFFSHRPLEFFVGVVLAAALSLFFVVVFWVNLKIEQHDG